MWWTSQSNDDQVKVSIGPRRDLFAILFLVWWIALWIAGEVTLFSVTIGGTEALLSGDVPNTISTFRYLWPLIGAGTVTWTVIGVGMIYSLLWELLGREEITLSADGVTIHRSVAAVSSSRAFPRREASNVRFDDRMGWLLSNLDYWGLAGGKLAFEFGGKTIRFGRGLEASAARSIAGVLNH